MKQSNTNKQKRNDPDWEGNSRTKFVRQESLWEFNHDKYDEFTKHWTAYANDIEIANIKTYHVLEFLSDMFDKGMV